MRTLAWLGRWRRISKDYEILESTVGFIIYAIMLHVMTSRLVRKDKHICEERKNALTLASATN